MHGPVRIKGIQRQGIYPVGGTGAYRGSAEIKILGSVDVINRPWPAITSVGIGDDRPGSSPVGGGQDFVRRVIIQRGNYRVLGVLRVHADVTCVPAPVGRRGDIGPCFRRDVVFPNLSREGDIADVVGAIVIAEGHPKVSVRAQRRVAGEKSRRPPGHLGPTGSPVGGFVKIGSGPGRGGDPHENRGRGRAGRSTLPVKNDKG